MSQVSVYAKSDVAEALDLTPFMLLGCVILDDPGIDWLTCSGVFAWGLERFSDAEAYLGWFVKPSA